MNCLPIVFLNRREVFVCLVWFPYPPLFHFSIAPIFNPYFPKSNHKKSSNEIIFQMRRGGGSSIDEGVRSALSRLCKKRTSSARYLICERAQRPDRERLCKTARRPRKRKPGRVERESRAFSQITRVCDRTSTDLVLADCGLRSQCVPDGKTARVLRIPAHR